MPAPATVPTANRPPRTVPGPDDDLAANAHSACEFLKALAHESRLLILCLLIDGERTVGEIEQMLGLRQSAVSQQLTRLRADDLVKKRRSGKNIYYSLSRPEVKQIIRALQRAFCHGQTAETPEARPPARKKASPARGFPLAQQR